MSQLMQLLAAGALLLSTHQPLIAQAKSSPTQQPKKNDADSGALGPRTLKLYPVPEGTAEGFAKILREIYKPEALRVVAVSPTQVAVYTNAVTHLELSRQPAFVPRQAKIISLTGKDAVKIAARLRMEFGDPKSGGPSIEADADYNSVNISGSAEQIKDVETYLTHLEKGTELMPNTRVIQVDYGNAALLAEALVICLPELRPKDSIKLVRLESPDGTRLKPGSDKNPVNAETAGATITFIPLGDRLIISTEDSDAMTATLRIVRLLLYSEVPICGPETIRLKHASATKLVKVLDAAFNQKANGERVERVRVLVDPDSNAILFRARPLDAMALRRLVTELDVPAPAKK